MANKRLSIVRFHCPNCGWWLLKFGLQKELTFLACYCRHCKAINIIRVVDWTAEYISYDSKKYREPDGEIEQEELEKLFEVCNKRKLI